MMYAVRSLIAKQRHPVLAALECGAGAAAARALVPAGCRYHISVEAELRRLRGDGDGPNAAVFLDEKPPRFIGRWHELPLHEQRLYLEAVRDHYGEGQIVQYRWCPRDKPEGVAAALIEPDMVPFFKKHDWRAAVTYDWQVASATAGRLHRAAAKRLLGGQALPGDLYKYMEAETIDGCTVNCLDRNILLKPRLHGGMPAQRWEQWLREQRNAGHELHPQLRLSEEAWLEGRSEWKRQKEEVVQGQRRAVRDKAEAAVLRVFELEGEEEALRVLERIQRRIKEWASQA